ncbi:MAG: DUF2279 domain-containing protein [Chitinophagales bacterium]
MRSASVSQLYSCCLPAGRQVSLTASFGKKLSISFILFLASFSSVGQIDTSHVRLNQNFSQGLYGGWENTVRPGYISKKEKRKRQLLIGSINVVGYGGSLIILNNTWYKNYPHTSFHTFNDNEEWLQVDKVGHAWTAYNTGRASAAMWRWAGLSEKKSAIIGGLSGVAYLTVIEFLDGHSSQWGWSWGDVGANIFGSSFFISQELLWKEQKIQYKFSFHHKDYGEPMLNQRADDLFGKVWYERMLKDYNAQTYWFSANIKSFFPRANLPAWLNVAVGYGADGMFGGFSNKWIEADSGLSVDRTDIPRKRQFYLAPDIDFTKIKTNKKWLRTVFFCLNAFKCPAPSLMIDSKGKTKAYIIYF